MNEYDISFRCFYSNGNKTTHKRRLRLYDIETWINSYLYCHPECCSISVNICFDDNCPCPYDSDD